MCDVEKSNIFHNKKTLVFLFFGFESGLSIQLLRCGQVRELACGRLTAAGRAGGDPAQPAIFNLLCECTSADAIQPGKSPGCSKPNAIVPTYVFRVFPGCSISAVLLLGARSLSGSHWEWR